MDTTATLTTDSEVDITGMMDSGRVGESVKDEDEEDRDCPGREKDDEEDDGDLNHVKLSKEPVYGHRPTTRGLNTPVWTQSDTCETYR